VDIGGQDSKVIVMGARGEIQNFAMNDKCAAGTGRFLEVASARLRIPLEQLGRVALGAPSEVGVSSTCTVFAESEIVSLLARGHPPEPIVRGLHRALIRRVSALARSAGIRPPVMLSGGVARNPAVQVILAEELGHEILVPDGPQLMGSYGAALYALEIKRSNNL
jgi:predicted CoA-substrate-specific enzyme activase